MYKNKILRILSISSLLFSGTILQCLYQHKASAQVAQEVLILDQGKALNKCKEKSNNNLHYIKACEDALITEDGEVPSDGSNIALTIINPSNSNLVWETSNNPGHKRVLVATFAKKDAYEDGNEVSKFFKEEKLRRPIWVTVVPELRRFCTYETVERVDLIGRVEKLLGLPPNSNYTEIAEIWVNPNDLRRPTLSPTLISEKFAPPSFPEGKLNLPLFSGLDETYRGWFRGLYANGYPFTGLGYTYDWGKPNEIGLSEFVIWFSLSSSELHIRKVYSLEEYCK